MPAEHEHNTRPGIELDQIYPLPELLYRARLSKTIWRIMLSQATAHGHKISLRVGSKTFVNTTKFAAFLELADSKNLKLTGGGP